MSDDERTARADAAAAKARAKALRPWYQRKRWWVAGVVALIAVIAIASGGGDDDTDVAADDTDSPPASAAESRDTTEAEPEAETTTTRDVDTQSGNTENPPPDDVAVTDCRTHPQINFMQTELTVTNNSSRRSNYIIQTVYESEDGAQQFGEGFAMVQNLEPGQTRVVEDASASEAPDEPFVCRVASVDRTAS